MSIFFLMMALNFNLILTEKENQDENQSEEYELLEGAENGRYKVVAKAEPYKNLPPAPVTPGDFYDVTSPSPNYGKHAAEGIQFAPLVDAKTQKFIPARQTPIYHVSTPSFSPTPPAIEFVTKPNEGNKKSPSTPQPGIFKISVEDVDFLPTPPPPKYLQIQLDAAEKLKIKEYEKKQKMKLEKEKSKYNKKKSAQLYSNEKLNESEKSQQKKKSTNHKNISNNVKTNLKTPNMKTEGKTLDVKEINEKVIDPREVLFLLGEERKKELMNPKKPVNSNNHPIKTKNKQQSMTTVKPKMRKSVSKTDIMTNEIENDKFERKDKKQAYSSPSVYDPRRRSRTYKKGLSKIKRYRRPKTLKRWKNYNDLPGRSKKNKQINNNKQKKSRKFEPEVKGYKPQSRTYDTVKRENTAQSAANVRQLNDLYKPKLSGSPFTAFQKSTPLTPSIKDFGYYPTPSQNKVINEPILVSVKEFEPRMAKFSKPVPTQISHKQAQPRAFRPLPSPVNKNPYKSQQTPQIYKPIINSNYAEEEEGVQESRPYSFKFGVNDEYSGVDYNRAESRSDLGVTRGSYKVALPDGRVQTVSYVADNNGFHATVSYEGQPTYPEKQKEYPQELKPQKKSYRASKKVLTSDKYFFQPKENYSAKPKNTNPKVSQLPRSPAPRLYTPKPINYSPTPTPYKLTTLTPKIYQTQYPYTLSPNTIQHSPTPRPFSPAPAAYPQPSPPQLQYKSPTPHAYSPSGFHGSPTPQPYQTTYSPTHNLTPEPIFHTTPSYVLGLKASKTPLPHYNRIQKQNPVKVKFHGTPKPIFKISSGYIPPTTWKPKYPKILEHTLRSAPSERVYGHKIKTDLKKNIETDNSESDTEYDYDSYEDNS